MSRFANLSAVLCFLAGLVIGSVAEIIPTVCFRAFPAPQPVAATSPELAIEFNTRPTLPLPSS